MKQGSICTSNVSKPFMIYQELENWYCGLLTRHMVYRRATGNIKNAKQTESIDTRPCKHSVVALQDHCSYKAPSKHYIKKRQKWHLVFFSMTHVMPMAGIREVLRDLHRLCRLENCQVEWPVQEAKKANAKSSCRIWLFVFDCISQGWPTRRSRSTGRSPSPSWSIAPNFALNWLDT